MTDPGQELKDEITQRITGSKVFATLVDYLSKALHIKQRVQKIWYKLKSVL